VHGWCSLECIETKMKRKLLDHHYSIEYSVSINTNNGAFCIDLHLFSFKNGREGRKKPNEVYKMYVDVFICSSKEWEEKVYCLTQWLLFDTDKLKIKHNVWTLKRNYIIFQVRYRDHWFPMIVIHLKNQAFHPMKKLVDHLETFNRSTMFLQAKRIQQRKRTYYTQ
jgi:hypothetical protein